MTNAEIREICLGEFEKNKDIIEERAKENIEKYRKGNCTVYLTNKNGQPLKQTEVIVKQKDHEFKYGANIFMLDEFESDSENKKYREMFSEYFNLATVPFYWCDIEPEQNKLRYEIGSEKIYRRPTPDLCVEYCKEKGILPKLHCLVYDPFRPKWLDSDNLETQKQLYEKRFKEIAQRYGDKMYEIEVINELLLIQWGYEKYSCISKERDVIEWSFNLAKKYFPNLPLVINDGHYHTSCDFLNYRNPYFMLIDASLSKGTPIEKIGFQNHIWCFNTGLTKEKLLNNKKFFDPLTQIKGLDQFSEFNKPLEITEITIPTLGEGEEAEEIQAELLKYLYTIWFSTPLMESVVYWNTIENTAAVMGDWNENDLRGGLFRRDFTPKASAIMLKKLFNEVWRTNETLITDRDGKIDFRGFYGNYILEIKTDFGVVTKEISLSKNGETTNKISL